MGTLVAALALGFVLLAVSPRRASASAVVLAITTAIQRVEQPLSAALMSAITAFGYWPWDWLVLGAAVAGFWIAGYGRAALLIATPVPGLLTVTIETLVERPRPARDAVRVAHELLDFSYPSGHVGSFVSLYGLRFFLTYALVKRSVWSAAALSLLGTLVALVSP